MYLLLEKDRDGSEVKPVIVLPEKDRDSNEVKPVIVVPEKDRDSNEVKLQDWWDRLAALQ